MRDGVRRRMLVFNELHFSFSLRQKSKRAASAVWAELTSANTLVNSITMAVQRRIQEETQRIATPQTFFFFAPASIGPGGRGDSARAKGRQQPAGKEASGRVRED